MTEKENINKSGEISRREFLKDAGLLVGGTAIGSTILLAACGDGDAETTTVTKTTTSTVTEPGGAQTITVTKTVEVPVGEAAENVVKLTINGYEWEGQVEPQWNLKDFLHDRMGLIGVKSMCGGYGACGSCSVILDGKPVLSCMVLVIECNGAVIETSEGIAASQHPIIDAYIMNNAMQCGYCTPGFVVTAKALLDRNPNPTEADIREALEGNLCICPSYYAHVPAVLAAAETLGGA